MPRRRPSAPRGGFRQFPKRSGLWVPFDVSASLVTAGTVVTTGDLLGNYFGQTGEEVPVGSTISSVRGRWQMSPASAAVDRDAKVEAVMQLLPEGGRSTDPVPGVDIIDAMWYGQMFYTGHLLESAAGVFSPNSVDQVFETKAMRKVTGNGQVLVISAVCNVSTDFDMNWIGNLFLKLP